jgi:hypothetical protein
MNTHCAFCEVVTALSYTDVPRLTQFPGTQFQTRNFTDSKKNEIKFVKIVLIFSWLEWKGRYRDVAEEYCWAVTHATGRSGYSRPTLRVLWSRIAPVSPLMYIPVHHIHMRSIATWCLACGNTTALFWWVSVLCTCAGEKNAVVLWLLTQPLELCTQPHSAWCTTGDNTTSEQIRGQSVRDFAHTWLLFALISIFNPQMLRRHQGRSRRIT